MALIRKLPDPVAYGSDTTARDKRQDLGTSRSVMALHDSTLVWVLHKGYSVGRVISVEGLNVRVQLLNNPLDQQQQLVRWDTEKHHYRITNICDT